MEENILECPECSSIAIQIVTLAVHKSSVDDSVLIDSNGIYSAHNSDSSWESDDRTAKFICTDCSHEWPVDKEIYWIWDD